MNRKEILEQAKPILFNTEMVQQLPPRGIKTQTRRVVKPQIEHRPDDPYYTIWQRDCTGKINEKFADMSAFVKCKARYQPGDILWVRETWYYENHMHDLTTGEPDLSGGGHSHRYRYRADNPEYPVNVGVGPQGWRPSIFMPREAARIFLRVKRVWAERVQEISDQDCFAEGVVPVNVDIICMGAGRTYYRKVWDTINAKRDDGKYAWAQNPWVWCYEFERLEG